jgi:diguanylate cyclase (GGDEF)-like protein/PAS domain S-box-containing protein
VPAGTACVVAAGTPAPDVVADSAVALLGLATAVLLWWAGRGDQRGLRGWRLLAVALVLPVVGFLAAHVARPGDPMELVLVRWLPTVPGYVLAVVGVLTLVDRSRLRTGTRAAIEVALFGTACLISVQLLVLGPDRSWTGLGPAEAALLTAAVVATSAAVTAALVLLGTVDRGRQRMALLLLGGAVLVTSGRALATSAMLSGSTALTGTSRLLVVGGLVLVGAAALTDPGPCPAGDPRHRPGAGRSTQLGSLLPHLAMVVALAGGAIGALVSGRPSVVSVAGVLACAVLTTVHRCVTARDERRLGARLRRSEAYFRSLVGAPGDGVLILDGDLRVSWASPSLGALLGTPGEEVVGRDLPTLVHPEDALPVAGALQGGDRTGPDGLVLLRVRHADGSWRHLEASLSDLRADPVVGAVVLHCRDVTARVERERDLEQVAFTDPLTGLPNRAGCARLLEEALAAAGTPGSPCRSLLLIELDGLDEVREHAGRDVEGDVLVETGRRLRATVRGSEPVAHVGGGAFAVVAEDGGTTADLLADRCLSVIEQPLTTRGGVFDLSASVGVVELATGVGVAEVLARAELAVRAAAGSGSGTALRYGPALGNAADRRARLRDDLPGVTGRGELSVLFQPIVSLEEQRVTGVEALLRWQHPELGEVPPAEFVPIAERAGVIGELQRWALEEAARAAVALPETGAPLRLGVNISASHVAARSLVGDVAAVLRTTGLAPERLVLEITEDTVAADGDYVAVDFEALRLMGVHVALDDFGTGHSSLAHLTRLPLDILKLDRALVNRVDRDPKTRALCESVVAIGKALGLDVVAEGVETPAQLGALRGLGCGFAQGFLLSRPMRPGELATVLTDGAGVLWPGLVGTR